MVKVRIDMTGWNMWEHGVPDSKLTVLYQVEDHVTKGGNRVSQWLCECSCQEHNRIVTRGDNLRNGVTKSCGCYRKDVLSETKKNEVKFFNDYCVLLETNTGKEVFFDSFNAQKILQYTWSEDSHGYPCAWIDGKKTRMHVLLGYKGYDHKNRNKKDNRVQNLRPCTTQNNTRNRTKKEGCSSKYIGLCQDRGKWKVSIKTDDGRKNLGRYSTEEEALIVRLKAEKKYFGEFAPQRDLFEQYDI